MNLNHTLQIVLAVVVTAAVVALGGYSLAQKNSDRAYQAGVSDAKKDIDNIKVGAIREGEQKSASTIVDLQIEYSKLANDYNTLREAAIKYIGDSTSYRGPVSCTTNATSFTSYSATATTTCY